MAFLYSIWNARFGHAHLATRLGAVFIPGAVAGVIYWAIAFTAKIPGATDMVAMVRRKMGA